MRYDAETITDATIEAIRDAACECRPRPEIESPEAHAYEHQCDVEIYDMCVVALEAVDEEGYTARHDCAELANLVSNEDDEEDTYNLYYRALNPEAKP